MEGRSERSTPSPCFTSLILGFHGDTEKTAAVLETASAEAPPDLPAQSCTGDAELPAAERVGGPPGHANHPSSAG